MARKGRSLDRFMNRYRSTISTAADSTTAVVETFNTGMNLGAGDKFKWIIYGFSVKPSGIVAAAPYAAASVPHTFTWQLCSGTPAALLAATDMQLICEAKRTVVGADATASAIHDWPIRGDLPFPTPVFANQLSVIYDASVNVANMQSKEFEFTIHYLTAGISDGEIVEFFQAYGGL